MSRERRTDSFVDLERQWIQEVNHRHRRQNALFAAITSGSLLSVRWLLNHGFDPNIRFEDSKQDAPLHIVVTCKEHNARRTASNIISELLSNGADIFQTNNLGLNPINTARREVHRFGLARVLRTLEMNGAIYSGTLSLEEHHEFAKIAGRVGSFLDGVGGARRTQNTGLSKLQSDITGVLGGSYKPRWCLLLGGGVPGPEWGTGHRPDKRLPSELVIYPSFEDTEPILIIDATQTFSIVLDDTEPKSSIGSLLQNIGFQKPQSESVRFLLKTPDVGYRFEAPNESELERWRRALRTEASQSAIQQPIGREDSDGARGASGAAMEPVEAVPIEGPSTMLAEAVVIDEDPRDHLNLPTPPGMTSPNLPTPPGMTSPNLPTPPGMTSPNLPSAPPTGAISSTQEVSDSSMIPGMIKELKELLDMGAISEEEFHAKKNELLQRY